MQYTSRSCYANEWCRRPRVGDQVRLVSAAHERNAYGMHYGVTYTVISISEWPDGDTFIRVTPEQHQHSNGTLVRNFYVLPDSPVTQTRRLTVRGQLDA